MFWNKKNNKKEVKLVGFEEETKTIFPDDFEEIRCSVVFNDTVNHYVVVVMNNSIGFLPTELYDFEIKPNILIGIHSLPYLDKIQIDETSVSEHALELIAKAMSEHKSNREKLNAINLKLHEKIK